MSADYVPKHDYHSTVGLEYLLAFKVRARIGNVARQRRLQQEYELSIHSMEDDPHAGHRARAMIERRTQRPEDCASSAEFVHPA